MDRYTRQEWPRWLAKLRAEREAARALPTRKKLDDVPRGGCCAECGATPIVNATSLCAAHYAAALARVRDGLSGRKPSAATFNPSLSSAPKPPAEPLPRPRTIDPRDVFKSDRARVPRIERARHMARWVAQVGEPVTRADAVRVAGLEPDGGSGRRVIEAAAERGWIKRGRRGCVLPGDTPPD